MQLQIGKQYKTRDGSGIALIEKDYSNDLGMLFPYRGKWVAAPAHFPSVAGGVECWRHDGGWDEPDTDWNCWDLVEEVP